MKQHGGEGSGWEGEELNHGKGKRSLLSTMSKPSQERRCFIRHGDRLGFLVWLVGISWFQMRAVSRAGLDKRNRTSGNSSEKTSLRQAGSSAFFQVS